MDFSSPLAAMRPQPCPAWANRKDLPASRHMFNGFGAANFDFKTLSMNHRPTKPDYFTLKPLRGSSPTASLTADLDANFHIDKSPQAPTPRRALFTLDVTKSRNDDGQLSTPPFDVEGATTPPIPSSSPYFDSMDISPLPHKMPQFVAQITLPSPTPEEPEDLPSANLLETQLPMQPPSFLLPERRRSTTRPGLSRLKAASLNNIPQRPNSAAETRLPPFRFGNVASSGLSCSSTPTLLESFTESPVDDFLSPSVASMPPPPQRRPVSGYANRCNGSPSSGHVRKPSGGRSTFVRPQRKLMRRSLSMFQNPADVMKDGEAAFEPMPSAPASIMDEQQEHLLKLPNFTPEDEPDSLPRITPDTMADVLEGKYDVQYSRIRVIDCRFEYEFNGGHIGPAENYNDKEALAQTLFDGSTPANTLLIFHCEYSVHRAPLSAKFIRNHDRKVNAANYPSLTHHEMYILNGGYKSFYEQHPSKCTGSYVEMGDERHEAACERGMAKVKSQRQKLFRHSTFAFGQSHDEDMADSPTAQGRMLGARSQSTFDIPIDLGQSQGLGNPFQRRMASYP